MPQSGRPAGRSTLADLLILVAAAAVGMAMLRPYLAALAAPSFGTMTHPSIRTIEATYGIWSIIAAWWMLALLLIQYRRPHPRRGRLARRPGHAACCAAAVALALGAGHQLARLAWPNPARVPFSFYQLWITVSVQVGPTVLGAWLLLVLSGRWRADPGWVDRLGRLLGSCWIGWMLFWTLPSVIRSKIPPMWDWLFA